MDLRDSPCFFALIEHTPGDGTDYRSLICEQIGIVDAFRTQMHLFA